MSNYPKGFITWHDMTFTVYAEQDEFVEAKWPSDLDILAGEQNTPNDQDSKLYISVGSRGKLDYMPKGTVLGTDAGDQPIRAAKGGFVNDDRAWMEDIARITWVWNSVERSAITIGLNNADYQIKLGSLIAGISSEEIVEQEVNSVVTSIEHDYRSFTTNIRTEYAELDGRQFAFSGTIG